MAELTESPTVSPPSLLNRQLVGRLITAALIGFALFLFVSGFADHKSSSPSVFPQGLEAVSPANLATNVPKQSTVLADLEFGYTGTLTISGSDGPKEIPLDQLDYVRATGNLSFTPADEKDLSRLPGDNVRVTVRFWEEAKGEAAAKEYTWSFNVL